MRQWGDRHAAPAGPPLELMHRDCGHISHDVMTCSACGKPIGPKDVQALPGPGAAEPLADRRLADAVLDQGLQNALALLSAGQQR